MRVLDAEAELRAAREQLRQNHADYAQARSMLAAQFAAETAAWQQKVEVKNATLRQLAECAQNEQHAQSRLREEWAAARREFDAQLHHCKTSNECVRRCARVCFCVLLCAGAFIGGQCLCS